MYDAECDFSIELRCPYTYSEFNVYDYNDECEGVQCI